MSPKATRWSPLAEAPSASTLARHAAAGALRSASALLARLARRLSMTAPRQRFDAQLEFYAEAGAPEGALYLDGQLVGWLSGVKRL
mgnify:CR=1 FL=1